MSNLKLPCRLKGNLRLCPLILSLMPGRRDWTLPGYMLFSGSCREQWDLPWDSFSPGWGPGAAPNSTCNFRHFTSSITLLWTHSRSSVSFLNWMAQKRTQYLRCGLTSVEHRERITFSVLLVTPLLIQARILATQAELAYLSQLWTTTPFPLSSFLATLPPACSSAKGFIVAKVQNIALGPREFSLLEG